MRFVDYRRARDFTLLYLADFHLRYAAVQTAIRFSSPILFFPWFSELLHGFPIWHLTSFIPEEAIGEAERPDYDWAELI